MMKFIDPKSHGIIDFVYITTLALGPSLLNFGGLPAMLSYVLAGSVLVLALCTRYPFGAVKLVPFTTHGAIELVSSLVVIGAPWMFGFSGLEPARNFFVAAGVLLFAVWTFTDYKAADIETPIG